MHNNTADEVLNVLFLIPASHISVSIPHDFDPEKHVGKNTIRPPYEAFNQARPFHYSLWNQHPSNEGSYSHLQRQNPEYPNINHDGHYFNGFQEYVPNDAQQTQQGQIPKGYLTQQSQQGFSGPIDHNLPIPVERSNFNIQSRPNQKTTENSLPKQQSNLPIEYGYPTSNFQNSFLTGTKKWSILPQTLQQDVSDPFNKIPIKPYKLNSPVVPNRRIHKIPENVFIDPNEQYIYPKNIEQSYNIRQSPIVSSLLKNNRHVNKPEVVTTTTNTVAGSFVPPIPSRPDGDTITSKLTDYKIIPPVEIKEFKIPPVASVKFEDRDFASASNPVETRLIKPPNYKVQQLIADSNIRNVLSTTKHEKRYLVIYPNGTVGHIDRLETIAQSNPNYVLINSGDIIKTPIPKEQKVQESKVRTKPIREIVFNKLQSVSMGTPMVNITSPSKKLLSLISVSAVPITNSAQPEILEHISLKKQPTNMLLPISTRNITNLVLNSTSLPQNELVPPINLKTMNVTLESPQTKTFLVTNSTMIEEEPKEKVKPTLLQNLKPVKNITKDASIDSLAPYHEPTEVYGKNKTRDEITSSSISSKDNNLPVDKVVAVSTDNENAIVSTPSRILEIPILRDANHNNEQPNNASDFSNVTSNLMISAQVKTKPLVENTKPTLSPKPKPIIIYGSNVTRDTSTESSASDQESIEAYGKNVTEKDIENPIENHANINKKEVIANKSSEVPSLPVHKDVTISVDSESSIKSESSPILPVLQNANDNKELPTKTSISKQISEELEILDKIPVLSEGNLTLPRTVEPLIDVNQKIVSPAKEINSKQTSENPKITEDSIASPSIVIPNITSADYGNSTRIIEPPLTVNQTITPSIEKINSRQTVNSKAPEDSIFDSEVLSNPTAEASLINHVLESPLDAKQKIEPLIEENSKQTLKIPEISEPPKIANQSIIVDSSKNTTDMPSKPETKESFKIPEGDLDISQIKSNEKPDIWIRTADGNILDKLTDHSKDYDVVYFFQIHSQPKIENDTTRTIYPNGTIVEETTKSVWENEEGPPIVTKSTRVINPEDNLNKKT
ncbi:unnamed protein product [Diatraea saccharalis]|uniref:Uncharacterized protein n=1 Tax=Diatraea saccharalis TaxID=40085 RepID=A0A9N9QXD6_9NEOP|nr:unnamed protein product [Diatraea saccharalis]